MNKGIKTLLILFVVSLLVGCVCIGTAVYLGGALESFGVYWDEKTSLFDHPEESTPRDTFVKADVSQLDIELAAGELNILEEDVDQIQVTVEGNYQKYIEVNAGEALSIKDTRVDKKKKRFGGNQLEITIVLPKNKTFEKTTLKTGAAQANIVYLNTEDLKLQVGAGEVDMDALECANMTMNIGVGEADIHNANVKGDMDIDVGVGELNLELVQPADQYNYSVKCGVGEVNIFDNSSAGGANDLKVDHQAPYNMEVRCGVGEVNITSLSGQS